MINLPSRLIYPSIIVLGFFFLLLKSARLRNWLPFLNGSIYWKWLGFGAKTSGSLISVGIPSHSWSFSGSNLDSPRNWKVHLCLCLFLRQNYMSENIIQGLVLSNIQTEFKDFEISCRHFSKFISCSVADFESLFLVKGQKSTEDSKFLHSRFWRIPKRKENQAAGGEGSRRDWV